MKQIFSSYLRNQKFRRVFYNICYYFWGHHCCYAEKGLANLFSFLLPSLSYRAPTSVPRNSKCKNSK